MKKTLITGGAGFIGSHLIDTLLTKENTITVLDNLTTGTPQNIQQWLGNPNLTFIKADLLNPVALKKLEPNHYDTIFHLAANPEVKIGATNPKIHFQQNITATHNLLETIRKTKNKPTLVFTSTSTVYGEPTKIPTPENYAPLKPISTYGASKLACEALISAYAHTYNFKAIIIRLANIVGPRSQHGVVHDFIQKLNKNPNKLEILGDGTQNKSYLYITDCINAILLTLQKSKEQVNIYNIGSEDQTTVTEIAKIITQEMGIKNVKFKFTGGVDGGRGWKGDVKNMLLDISKLKTHEWKPKYNSQQAITKTVKHLTNQPLASKMD
ncbi:MAG: UDP-glucose 4-epimerase [Deltaproteobacteria bacterium CG03_land_8_20_14_0_80_45_14]|nr:MAG: UDP-glucose 4-epimerase [Deltaproteobacteria bacterium CG03_land_8_20_14_0_80_45_14]